MKKSIKLALWAMVCIVALWNVVGYGVRAFLDPKLLSSSSEYQLYIHLSSTVHDFPSANPLSFGLSFKPNVWDVEQGLRAAADDNRISSALIHLDNVRLTVSQAETMGEAIKYFRSKGKKVTCYAALFGLENGNTPAYLLASYCDTIQLQRLGSVALETLKPNDILGEDYTAEEFQHSAVLTKIDADVETIIRTNRRIGHQDRILNNKHYIDIQAVKAGLIDEIAPRINQSAYTIVIQDYVRLLEKANRNKTNVVAVIPITEAVSEEKLKAICARPDIQAVVIQAKAGANYSAEKIGNKPVVVCVANLESIDGRSLNRSIETALKLAALDKHTVHVEVIHSEGWMSRTMKGLSSLSKSIVLMFKRSVNYVTTMIEVRP